MRELTDLEIEAFDFTGRIPELNTPSARSNDKAGAKISGHKINLNVQPRRRRSVAKGRLPIRLARTA